MSNVVTLPDLQTDWLPRLGAQPEKRPDLLRFGFHDYDNAQRLIAIKGEDMKHCHAFKKWVLWDGRRYAIDTTEQARRFAQEVMIEFLRQAVDANNEAAQKFAKQSLDSRRLTAMLREAEPHLVITPDQLDTNPDLLNFVNVTVNLRTGEQRPHDRTDMITKVIYFPYDPEAPCPVFMRFLYRIMGDGPDASENDRARADRLVRYLQIAIGYSLTGHTIEKVVFLLHGGGNNGKTTLLSLFLKILEEYAVLLQIDTLMVRRESNNTQADLADLRGARFVMTSETEEGQRLAEGKLKRITQGMGKIKDDYSQLLLLLMERSSDFE